jgi:hypothetical protein
VLDGHKDSVNSVAMSADGRWAVSGASDNTLRLWELDWDYDFPAEGSWDECATSCLEDFLVLHCQDSQARTNHNDQPKWTEHDFSLLLTDLRHRGFGCIRPENVRQQLEQMAAAWQVPPLFPRNRNKSASK